MMNLSAFIQSHASRTPDRTALIYDDAEITYAMLAGRVGELARWLSEQGIGVGDVVAVVMKNSPAFVEIAVAVSHLGGVFLPINYRLARDEVAYILDNSGAAFVFADTECAGAVEGAANLALLDDAMQRDITVLTGRRGTAVPTAYRKPDDLFRLMYTSGTTDHPKGVMHTYSNFYWKTLDHVLFLGLTRDDRILVVGPLYHVGAFDLPGIALLWVCGTMCILRDFDEAKALGAIERHGLTCAWFAPVMLGRLLAYPGRERFDLGTLRWAIGGGERTPEARIRAFTGLFPQGRYIDAYGLTETGSGDTLMEAGREIEKIGSTGRALPHCEIDIRDDAGRSLPPGAEGEICVRGPKVTVGYWQAPEKTAASFHPGGWLRTGDVGLLDRDGFLFVTDRKKDMILSGGENIASLEVERVIHTLPQVADAAVISVPDERWGERPVAVIVLKPGESLDYESLARHCRAHLAGFKIPRELHLRDTLPRNPSGKILKRVLRDELMDSRATQEVRG